MTKNRIKLLEDEFNTFTQKFRESSLEVLKESFKQFFEINPSITAVVWDQYTPYFNDGDTCEFTVYDPSFTNVADINEVNYTDYDGDDETVFFLGDLDWVMSNSSSYDREKELLIKNNVNIEACNDISSLVLSPAMYHSLKTIFGDHVRVIATPKGFESTEVTHD